jgi:leucyl aminopeptidase
MLPDLKSVFSSPDEADAEAPRPVHLVEKGALGTADGLTADQLAWAKANAFDGSAGSAVLVPAAEAGAPPVALVGIGEAAGGGEPCGPGVLNLGRAPGVLPKGRYTLASGTADATLASIAWGLGGYRFSAFKAKPGEVARLVVPEAADADRVRAVVAACHLGRDMINTPANAMGPEEIAQSAKAVGEAFGAEVSIARGEDAGFAEAYPLIDAVGRASDRKPRLVDLKWGDANAPKITLVGKGIAFDTGGLDLKPPAGMLLMKKDMGGAAAALAAAAMIMALKLPVRLRLLIATAENSVSGNAFRPGDVIKSRGGHTVEIGNTDAEGRLVLADALAVGDEDAPDTMITFATLTGAARVALGADLPALFSTDDDLAARIMAAVWKLAIRHGACRSGLATTSSSPGKRPTSRTSPMAHSAARSRQRCSSSGSSNRRKPTPISTFTDGARGNGRSGRRAVRSTRPEPSSRRSKAWSGAAQLGEADGGRPRPQAQCVSARPCRRPA